MHTRVFLHPPLTRAPPALPVQNYLRKAAFHRFVQTCHSQDLPTRDARPRRRATALSLLPSVLRAQALSISYWHVKCSFAHLTCSCAHAFARAPCARNVQLARAHLARATHRRLTDAHTDCSQQRAHEFAGSFYVSLYRRHRARLRSEASRSTCSRALLSPTHTRSIVYKARATFDCLGALETRFG